MSKIAVIIAAGGKGERFGSDEKKAYARLDGRPVFLRTIELFANREDVCQTILAVASDDIGMVREKFGPNLGFMGVKFVEGGPTRCETVAAALAEVADDAAFIAIHDAVRPCTTEDMIEAVFAAARKHDAAILAAPLNGTIKKVDKSGIIEQTVSRYGLQEAQTPQVFRADILKEAYKALPEDPAGLTDDAKVVELTGQSVYAVAADATNLKITTKSDMVLAAAVLKSRPQKSGPKLGAFEEAQW